ncbi:hypothetical protein SLEP1_g34784 [Rubroshorea leprosula]|uniref:Uncharacterized protein n=1 Tax=Rubroshorea leprosula TaxID=152421 RepID=A0AAV5KL50_9ROSI|nr:hypothetical protein SLEP1_g34784 [Rubroshorea leprosula]
MATALQSSTRTAPVAFSRQFTGLSSSSRGSGSVSFPHNISIKDYGRNIGEKLS